MTQRQGGAVGFGVRKHAELLFLSSGWLLYTVAGDSQQVLE